MARARASDRRALWPKGRHLAQGFQFLRCDLSQRRQIALWMRQYLHPGRTRVVGVNVLGGAGHGAGALDVSIGEMAPAPLSPGSAYSHCYCSEGEWGR